MVQNIPIKNAALFFNQQIPASEGTLQKNHVEHDDGRKALTPVEAHQLLLLVGQQRDAEPFDRRAGQ